MTTRLPLAEEVANGIKEVCFRIKEQGGTELPCHVVCFLRGEIKSCSLFNMWPLRRRRTDTEWELVFPSFEDYYKAIVLSRLIWKRHYSVQNSLEAYEEASRLLTDLHATAVRKCDELGVNHAYLTNSNFIRDVNHILRNYGIRGSIKDTLRW